jgi:hypothetical protein
MRLYLSLQLKDNKESIQDIINPSFIPGIGEEVAVSSHPLNQPENVTTLTYKILDRRTQYTLAGETELLGSDDVCNVYLTVEEIPQRS